MWKKLDEQNYVMEIGGDRLLLKTIDIVTQEQSYGSYTGAKGKQSSVSTNIIELNNVKLEEREVNIGSYRAEYKTVYEIKSTI